MKIILDKVEDCVYDVTFDYKECILEDNYNCNRADALKFGEEIIGGGYVVFKESKEMKFDFSHRNLYSNKIGNWEKYIHINIGFPSSNKIKPIRIDFKSPEVESLAIETLKDVFSKKAKNDGYYNYRNKRNKISVIINN